MEKIIDSGDTQFSSLIHKAKYLAQLDQLLKQHLDFALASHCKVANCRENILVIETDSASWNMLLQFHLPRLMEEFRRAIPKLSQIRSYVRPAISSAKKTQKTARLSQQSSELISRTADYVENLELKAALKRLAKSRKICDVS